MAIGQSKIDEIGFSESESKSSRPSMTSQALIIESGDNKCVGSSGTRDFGGVGWSMRRREPYLVEMRDTRWWFCPFREVGGGQAGLGGREPWYPPVKNMKSAENEDEKGALHFPNPRPAPNMEGDGRSWGREVPHDPPSSTFWGRLRPLRATSPSLQPPLQGGVPREVCFNSTLLIFLYHMRNSDFIGDPLKELLAASYSSEMCTVKDHQKCDLLRYDKMPLWDGLDQRRCGRFCWSNRPQSAGKICRN
ncbi:hypothetical protein FH972_020322 [Carpinus fangiana]|uniref:Uncharacterized protein n=1 Tax=Carpinus fangiana TaxID=176857 RepID=A0A5N6RUF6_9ROSI|nr:hypothetical protein FH972_020322 [Carpinus fangiana]